MKGIYYEESYDSIIYDDCSRYALHSFRFCGEQSDFRRRACEGLV